MATVLLLAKGIAFEPWRLRVPSKPISGAGEHVIFPVGAVNHLAEHGFRGNVFVPYDWGSYVMWKLGPGVQISHDSRYEVAYPAWRLEEDHAFFAASEGWQLVLTKYPTDLVLVPNRLPIAAELNQTDRWRRVYRDSQFAMFARDGVELETFETDRDPPAGVFP